MSIYNIIISKFNKQNILVVGDLILDQYIKGSVSRISPEAPVPIVVEEESFYTPGGAANVAHNLTSLGAKVSLVGRIGQDEEGQILLKELKKGKVNSAAIFVDPHLPTICKTRVIVQHQQLVRIDREKTTHPADKKITQKIFDFIQKNIDDFGAVIISDYGKGLIDAQLVNFVCSLALEKKKIITVDPKVEHFNFYRRVTAITPNLKETENAIRNIKITSTSPQKFKINVDKLENDEDIDLAGRELVRYLDLKSLLITLGERGMRLFENGQKPVHIHTKAKEIFDVTGAGDTVIALFTLSLAAGATKREAAEIANFAAGIVVGKMGAAAVGQEELMGAMEG